MSEFDPHDEDLFSMPAGELESLEEETDPPGVARDVALGLALLEDFMAIVQQLDELPGVSHVSHSSHGSVSEVTLQLIEDGLGHPLSDEIVTLYRLLNGLSLIWEAQEVDQRGALHVVDFDTLFGPWLDSVWVEDDELSEEHKDLLWTLRPIDAPKEAEVWTCIQVHEDMRADALYLFHRQSKEVLPLDLQLIDYIYCSLGAWGAPGWQFCFVQGYDWGMNRWEAEPPEAWIARLSALGLDVDREFFLGQRASEEEEE